MFEVDPKSLSDTRVQLHWASQLLSSAADAKMPKTDDDSHSNLGWNEITNQLEGRTGTRLDITEFAIWYNDDSFSLINQSLADGASWLGRKLESEIGFRDYEMPKHIVGNGGLFTPNPNHLKAIANWFSFGKKAFENHGELRVWPHHFDLGFWNATHLDGKSIGGGFTLGDQYYAQPYFYINPYGIDRPEVFPSLSHGHWTPHWMGAVLTAEELEQGDTHHIVKHFADEALERCRELMT